VTNLFDLTGKVALITGGSRGLGLQMALAFARAGADIIVASRKLENCQAVAQQITAMGRRALALSVHAGQWSEIDRLVEQAYSNFERIDILVNNAGMSPSTPSHEVTEELFDKVVGLNFKGPFRLAALVAQRMASGQGGSIINISSAASWKAMPRVVAYAAAKAALNAMTISLAQEYGPNVRVNAIAAGPFLTDISKAWSEQQRETAPNAVGRPGRPEEIVTSALFLASPASSYVSGTVVRCDGALR
jgi:NAD(P)-dependent dehydrogenase (short-subunit alcohol dehydrogenase family)